MNKLLTCGAVAALAVGIAPAFAQSAPPPGVAPGTAPVAAPGPMPQVHTNVRIMTNREMTRGEVADHVRKMFSMLDGNKDGYLTPDEVGSFGGRMQAMHGEMDQRMADRGVMMGDPGAMFDRLDTNHDGAISRQEFMASHGQMRQTRVIVMRQGASAPGEALGTAAGGMHRHGMMMGGGFGGHLFGMADANKDGRVSLAEAQAAALAHFDKADVNHDGKLTPDERAQAHALRHERKAS